MSAGRRSTGPFGLEAGGGKREATNVHDVRGSTAREGELSRFYPGVSAQFIFRSADPDVRHWINEAWIVVSGNSDRAGIAGDLQGC